MAATLAELGATPATRRIAVLGAMRELGADEDRYHAELAEPLLAARIDHAVLVGPEMAALADALGKSGAPRLPRPCKSIMCKPVPRPPMCWRGSALQAATRSSSRVRIRLVWARW
jgi:hypothetical protein